MANRKYRVAVITGPQFDNLEHFEIIQYFASRNYTVDVMSDLKGKEEAEFHGNDPDKLGKTIKVKKDIAKMNVVDYDAVLVVGGYCSAYLRAPETFEEGVESPTIQFMRKAVTAMDASEDGPVVGVHCHSLWLLAAAPDLMKGRKVTSNHNVVWDVINAGAEVQFTEDGSRTLDYFVDGKFVTGRERATTGAFCEAVFTVLEKV